MKTGLHRRAGVNSPRKPFQTMTYTAAVDVLQKAGEKFEYPVSWGADLQAEH